MFSSFTAFTNRQARCVWRPCGCFERGLAFFLEDLELRELGTLPLANFVVCDVEQKDLEDFEQWESEQYDFYTLFSQKIDLSDWCEEITVLGRLDRVLIWVNKSFWDKLLISMRYFSGKFSECFPEQCGRMFVVARWICLLKDCHNLLVQSSPCFPNMF